jgi:hypothetical protein
MCVLFSCGVWDKCWSVARTVSGGYGTSVVGRFGPVGIWNTLFVVMDRTGVRGVGALGPIYMPLVAVGRMVRVLPQSDRGDGVSVF